MSYNFQSLKISTHTFDSLKTHDLLFLLFVCNKKTSLNVLIIRGRSLMIWTQQSLINTCVNGCQNVIKDKKQNDLEVLVTNLYLYSLSNGACKNVRGFDCCFCLRFVLKETQVDICMKVKRHVLVVISGCLEKLCM